MARTSTPKQFAPGALPVLEGGSGVYTQRAMEQVSTALYSVQRMVPQVATREPRNVLDGMIRLARSPWWPVSGQTADAWVYYDGAGGVWRLLSDPPTSTGA